MGMFDNLRVSEEYVKLELPGKTVYQTKDLPCELNLFRINGKGRLQRFEPPKNEAKTYDWIVDEDDPRAFDPEFEKYWIDYDYTGELNFYTNYGKKNDGWIEYNVMLHGGEVDKETFEQYMNKKPSQ